MRKWYDVYNETQGGYVTIAAFSPQEASRKAIGDGNFRYSEGDVVIVRNERPYHSVPMQAPAFCVENRTTGERTEIRDCRNRDEAIYVAIRTGAISYSAGDTVSASVCGPVIFKRRATV